MPSVTVVIPVYNAAEYLLSAMESLVRQREVRLEMFAVNDGSTDESAGILDGLAVRNGNMRVFHQTNAGQGAARNRGLEAATGDYVYFMDADDALVGSDALMRLAEVMDRERLDVLFFDAETQVDADVEVSASTLRASDYIRRHDYSDVCTGRELFARFLKNRELCVSPCLMMLRRSFVEENRLRFPEARIFYEDNIFMTRVLLAACRASHRPWQLYVRKVHVGSTVMSAPTIRHLRGYLACYLDVRALLEKNRWNRFTRKALVEREVIYKLSVRRMVDSYPDLLDAACAEMTPDEWRQLEQVRRYPLLERMANGWRCLRDHGIGYTVKRICFGRQS